MREFLHKQERRATCALAALRSVLDLQFGVAPPELSLRVFGDDPDLPVVRYGADNAQLRRVVQGLSAAQNPVHTTRPWTYFVRNHGTLEALSSWLDRGRYPLASVYEAAGKDYAYHAVVVLRIFEDKIRIWDPHNGRLGWHSTERMVAWWNGDGKTTEYAVVGGGDVAVVLSRARARGDIE